jgi:uncharacterized cupin superfamily protein
MSHPVVLLLARADRGPLGTPGVAVRLSEHDPFVQGRQAAFIDDAGIAVGTVEASGSMTAKAYPFTEVLVVHRGGLVLHSQKYRVAVAPGQSVVIGRGTEVQVHAQPQSLWAFCAAARSQGPEEAGLLPIDRYAALIPSPAPEASLLTSLSPQCRANNLFESTGSTLRVGVWDSTPYARKARPQPVHELMHLLEGEVSLQVENGPSVTATAGDTLFVAKGAPCAWTSTVYVRKLYAVA